MMKKIFGRVKSLRIVMFISGDELNADKSMGIREQFRLLIKMMQGNIQKLANSIIPVITMLKP